MNGLWVAVAVSTPRAYDPDIGPVVPSDKPGGQRWQIGAIVTHQIGDHNSPPRSDPDGPGAGYKWFFYAGMTEDNLAAFLPLGVSRDDPAALKGNLRMKNYTDVRTVRNGAELAVDIETARGPREADVRALRGR